MIRTKTLVPAASVAFPTLAGVTAPRGAAAGARAPNRGLPRDGAPGAPLPFLVPQVDPDGNDIAGIRAPEVAVPLATYTGWNFRRPEVGAPEMFYPLLGSYIPLSFDESDRTAARDPRVPLLQRYRDRDAYLKEIDRTGERLVAAGYLLGRDLPSIRSRAGEHWDLLARRK